MPIYEYRCPECTARFEAIVPAAAADDASCRTCGAPAQRLLSVFSAPPRVGRRRRGVAGRRLLWRGLRALLSVQTVYELRLSSTSEDDTKAIGGAVAKLLATGDVVGLTGDLGAGKTRLVQGASAALGVEDRVVSPTFMLVREYDGELPVNHVDAYRLEDAAELEDLGLDGVLDPATVVFVEWADRVEGALPESWLEIRLIVLADDTRELTLVPHGRSWHDRAGQLQAVLAPFVVK